MHSCVYACTYWYCAGTSSMTMKSFFFIVHTQIMFMGKSHFLCYFSIEIIEDDSDVSV